MMLSKSISLRMNVTDFENRVARAIVILSRDDFDTEAEGKDGGSKMHVGSINIMLAIVTATCKEMLEVLTFWRGEAPSSNALGWR